ncbi:MAG: amino acid adenylation domain-containing protein, partial [Flavobacteriales bacterium]|nr:amino acid adenylation domain-containing protein [Flavobacteriales bacterium]
MSETTNTKVTLRKELIESLYSLTGMQQGMLFHSLSSPGEGLYIEQFQCKFRDLDTKIFQKCWEFVLEKHSILRTAFYHEAFNIPVQAVFKKVELPISTIDLVFNNEEELNAYLKEFKEEDRKRGFDLDKPPLMRLTLINSGNTSYLIWTFHHILLDGWSLAIVLEEILNAYSNLLQGKTIDSTAKDHFEEYIKYLNQTGNKQAEDYWSAYLKSVNVGTTLPFINSYNARNTGIGNYKELEFSINKKTKDLVIAFCQNSQITVNTYFQGIWAFLLHKYTSFGRVCFGATVSGRPENLYDIEKRVGLFINTIPIKTEYNENLDLAEWLRTIQSEQAESREFQYLPLNQIQACSGVVGDLFDTLMVFENYPVSDKILNKFEGLDISEVEVSEQNNYPLTITVEQAHDLHIGFNYNSDLIPPEYISLIAEQFKFLLEQFAGKKSTGLVEYDILPPEQKIQLENYSSTKADYPKTKTMVSLFEDQVELHPGETAVVFENKHLTYSELNERANSLAHEILDLGIGSQSIIPICVERSLEMIVGLLAILKAGGAYLPVDPEYPSERKEFMLEDSGAGLVVCSSATLKLIPKGNRKFINLDTIAKGKGKLRIESPKVRIRPADLAYVIYTSGSTGKPKGVMVEHRNVVRLFKTDPSLFDFNHKDVWCMFHSFSFDFSVWEIFGALFFGGKLIVIPKHLTRDVEAFNRMLVDQEITVLNQTPSAFYVLQDHVLKTGTRNKLRYMIFGGEALDFAKIKPWKSLFSTRMINMYGITETTVHVTFHEIYWQNLNSSASLIGKPIPTLSVYIMDPKFKWVPVGVVGEMYVGGEGVSRGYLNREDLTRDRFIDYRNSNKKERLYKTGDLGRWNPDGTLEYFGRADEQVKIRGFRIELGEIENILLEGKLVDEVKVLAIKDEIDNNRLVGYYRSSNRIPKESLTNYLSGKIPDFMVPRIWYEVENFELTLNGKIDVRKLKELNEPKESAEILETAANQNEFAMLGIWKEVIQSDQIGLTEDFFTIGGDSIKVISLLNKIRKNYGKEIKVADVYSNPTIKQLVEFIDTKKTVEEKLASKRETVLRKFEKIKKNYFKKHKRTKTIEDLFPVSDIQGGMIYSSIINPDLSIYHDQFIYVFNQKIEIEILKKAVSLMIRKHPMLRTSFDFDSFKEGIQIVHKKAEIKIKVFNKESLTHGEVKKFIHTYLKRERDKPFEVDNPPLMRLDLVKTKKRDVLLLQTHHAITDGWSIASFNTELNNLYLDLKNGKQINELEPLRSTYKDMLVESVLLKEQDQPNNFWKQELDGYKRLQIFTHEHENITLVENLDQELSRKLIRNSIEEGIEIKTVFFTAYFLALSYLSNEDEATVGYVSNTRPAKEDGDKIIGCFLNTLPFRNSVPGKDTSLSGFFETLHTKFQVLKKNEGITIFQIAKMHQESQSGRNPFFDAIFSFVNFYVYKDLVQSDGFSDKEEKYFGDVDLQTNTYLNFVVEQYRNTFRLHYRLLRKFASGLSLKEFKKTVFTILLAYADRKQTTTNILNFIDPAEAKRLLNIGSDSKRYQTGLTFVDLFEEQVRKNPDKIALTAKGISLSYKHVDERSNQLANCLIEHRIVPGNLVPVYMPAGVDLLIGIIGILKSGAAYVPIDYELPEGRVQHILKDLSSKVILTQDGKLKTKHKKILYNSLGKYPYRKVSVKIFSDDPAYVIYTSGSTGLPKGVLIRHESIVDYLFGLDKELNIRKCKSYALVSSPATDLGNTVIYSSLGFGGTLHVFNKQQSSDANFINQYFRDHKIDCLKIVPSHWSALSAFEEPLLPKIFLIFGGESLSVEIVEKILDQNPDCEIVNHYGPTETTIGKLLYRIDPDKREHNTIPIGKPFGSTRIFILSKQKSICPIGVPGELFIEGKGVSEGYLNNPDQSYEKFVDCPFIPDKKMYATGDLVKLNRDGLVEFLGRTDDQVKIRGYRIEPQEIERQIERLNMVRQVSIQIKVDHHGQKSLVAYVVPKEEYQRKKLLERLSEELPEYMIPGR